MSAVFQDGYPDDLPARIRGYEWELAQAEAAPGPETDFTLPTLLGTLAVALLDRYAVDGDGTDLDRAIELLLRATRLYVDHPDLPECARYLTVAYAMRAEAGGGTVDHDRAIAWARYLLDEHTLDDLTHDIVAAHLLDVMWDRSWNLRYGPDSDDTAGYAEADRLVADLAAVRLSGGYPVAQRYARLMLGAALLERHYFVPDGSDGSDLDEGIAGTERSTRCRPRAARRTTHES